MSTDDDVTSWVVKLKEGDGRAAEQIWDEYFGKLVGIARQKLRRGDRRVADEEDVVLSAFNSFYQRASTGQIQKLEDRQDLWKLLVTITVRKAYAQVRHNNAAKRGGGETRGESVFARVSDTDGPPGIEQVVSQTPTPALAVMVAETCDQLLSQLDEAQSAIASLKMHGYTNEEIAEELNCSTRRVTRKLGLIRKKWSAEET